MITSTIDLPENCHLQQLAIFFDSKDRFTVDQSLWTLMDPLHQAALLKHESYYYFERKLGDLTSESTRSYVRQEATARGLSPSTEGIASNTIKCYAYKGAEGRDTFYFHLSKNSLDNSSHLQFLRIGGRNLMVKTTAELADFKFDVTNRIDPQGRPYLVPSSTTVNQTLRSKVQTAHRNDWELQMSVVANQPITMTLLESGRPISTATLRICE